MLLYRKNGDFIGIGREELSFLGFEDMDQFKDVCSDVADLFVNKPGFIFKFKNFSWIDYTLNSGAPKKSVILKLKNGNEIETGIKIKEIFLYDVQNDEEIYYCVEFINNMTQPVLEPVDTVFPDSSDTKPALKVTEDIKFKPQVIEPIEEQKDITINFDNEIEIAKEKEDSIEDKIHEDLAVDFNQTSISETPDVKLKIDDDVFLIKDKEDKLPKDLTVDFNQTSVSETPDIKLKIDDDVFLIKDTPDVSIGDNLEIVTTTPDIEKEEDIKIVQEGYQKEDRRVADIALVEDLEEEIYQFDLAQCAEELGLDISLIAEVMNDYMQKVDKTIPQLKNCIDINDEISLQNHLLNLKGVSDNLHIDYLSKQLENIIRERRKSTRKEKVEHFEKMVAEFKDNIL